MNNLSLLQKNLSDMSELFTTRMASFEDSLKSRSNPQDITSLATDFTNFKMLIWKAVAGLKTQLDLVAGTLDDIEMKSRANILLLHGVQEEEEEDLSELCVRLCKDKLSIVGITKKSFSACFRLGVNNNASNPRPIVMRFMDHHTRNQVWLAKKLLKGSGLTLSEFLTGYRHAVFVEARKELGVKGCWTSNGRIVIVCPDGARRKIVSMAEFRAFQAEFPKTHCESSRSTTAAGSSPSGKLEQRPKRGTRALPKPK